MTAEEKISHLKDILSEINENDNAVCYLTSEDNELIESAIEALEKEPCEDCISREAVEDKLLRFCNELEGIFSDIREKNVDDSVCGLCEYDCDHGLDGYANECPGFERDDCFKLKEEYRNEWQSTKDLPPVQPKPKIDVLDKIRAEILTLDDAEYDFDGYYKAVTDALQIIDKYKAESEG